jgi:hypothetical protein
VDPRRALRLRPTGRGRCLAAVAAALVAGAAAAEPDGAHPWLSLAPPRPASEPLPPLRTTPLDAVEWSATLHASAGRAVASASLRARYRLDAEPYLQRKRADVDDLDRLLEATRDLDHHAVVLSWLAERCEGVWRAWQVALLDPLEGRSGGGEEVAFLSALHALLARTATTAATPDDVRACRLEPWSARVTLARDPPAAVADRSRARLSERAEAMMRGAAPATAWLEVDAVASAAGPDTLSLRVGLDVPLPGSRLALGLDRTGPDATITWHAPTIDDRITLRHGGESGSGSGPDEAEREEAFVRRSAEARLARAEARLRWSRVCGASAPAAVHDCLRATPRAAAEREALVGVIEAELAALQAELTLIAASGRHPLEVLGGAPPASEEGRRPPLVTSRPEPPGAPR